MDNKQIKLGAALSYFTIIFNIIAGLIYTPWMISKIGQANYGLYSLATSLIAIFVMDFGMSAAVTRFISRYKAQNDQNAINNFLGVVYKLYLAIDAIIFIALVVVYFCLNSIYNNLTPDQLETFKVLYIIVAVFSVISFPFTNLNGILVAHEKFIQIKLCDLFNKVFIIVTMVAALLLNYGVYALVAVNAIAGLIVIVFKLIIINGQTTVRVNFKFFDKGVLKSIFGFSAWVTVSSIMKRLIFNITPSIIAAVAVGPAEAVAIFGLGATIEGFVYSISAAVDGMFMPRISRIVVSGKQEEELMPLMLKIGRIQAIIIGLIVVGFIAVGRSFIVEIWNKPDFELSYFCTVLLIIPSFFFMPMQIADTTLVVENKVKYQSCINIIIGVLNVCVSWFLSRYYGAIGASISIFIAYMVRMVLSAVVYQRVLKLDMWYFIKNTFFKLVPPLLLALAVGLVGEYINPISNKYLRFAINGSVMTAFYFAIMWLFGFNVYEKGLIKGLLSKLTHLRKRA